MTQLLLLSYFIHFILLVATFLLFRQIRSINKTEVDEVYQVLDIYLEELKSENKKLKQLMNTENQKLSNPSTTQPFYEKPSKPQRQSDENSLKSTAIKAEYSVEHLEKQFRKNQSEIVKDETSTLSRALYLKDKGYSVSEIAKQLSCGKTEIELLLKLRT